MERIRDTLDYDKKHSLDSSLELCLNNGDGKAIYELVSKGANPSNPLFLLFKREIMNLQSFVLSKGRMSI